MPSKMDNIFSSLSRGNSDELKELNPKGVRTQRSDSSLPAKFRPRIYDSTYSLSPLKVLLSLKCSYHSTHMAAAHSGETGMILHKYGLVFIVVIALTVIGSIRAQSTEADGVSFLEAVRQALPAGDYLDAYQAAFMLTDSAPAALTTALAAAPETEADSQSRAFLLLFSGQPAEALAESALLPESPFTFVVMAAERCEHLTPTTS